MVPTNLRVVDAFPTLQPPPAPSTVLRRQGPRALRPLQWAASNDDTHLGGSSFGVVYLNSIAMESPPQSAPFRPGAIIVREKLATATSTTPEILSVMIKRAPGFNPTANDWEFLMVSGAVTEVKHREKTGECQACHTASKAKDFVFGSYVP